LRVGERNREGDAGEQQHREFSEAHRSARVREGEGVAKDLVVPIASGNHCGDHCAL
jgi:hypothetical protein